MKNFEAIPFTVASKTLKCLGENLPNHTYKILKTKQNKEVAEQRDIHSLWIPGQFFKRCQFSANPRIQCSIKVLISSFTGI